MYQEYRSWIESRGQYALSSPNFKAGMRAKSFWWRKTTDGAFFHGVQIKNLRDDG